MEGRKEAERKGERGRGGGIRYCCPTFPIVVDCSR